MLRSHRLSRLVLALALAPALACAQTWTGESPASGAWSQGKNWFGTNVPVAGATTHLTFAGSQRLDTFQDRADPFLLQHLSFAAGAGAFRISGGALRFAANAQIDLLGAAPVSIGSHVLVDQHLLLEGGGDLLFKGQLMRSGANPADNTRLVKQGGGLLTLAEPNPFDGLVEVNGGRIVLQDAQALAKAGVVLNVANGLDFHGAAAVTLGSLQGNGALDLSARVLNLGGDGRDTLYGGLFRADHGPAGDVVKVGGGALSLSAAGHQLGQLTVTDGSLQLLAGSQTTASGLTVLRDITQQDALQTTLKVLDGAALQVGQLSIQDEDFRTPGSTNARPPVRAWVQVAQGTLNVTQAWVGGGPNSASGGLSIGTGGQFSAGALHVGGSVDGEALFELLDGGQASTTQTQLAIDGGRSQAQVTGSGSRWVNSGSLWLGTSTQWVPRGNIQLLVADGGELVVGETLILFDSRSSVTVQGGTVRAGFLGSGARTAVLPLAGGVSIQDPVGGGAALVLGSPLASQAIFVGEISGSGSLLKTGISSQSLLGHNVFTGSVTVAGGELDLQPGAASAYRVLPGARLRLRDGLSEVNGGVQVAAGATLQLDNGVLVNTRLDNEGEVQGLLTLRNGAWASGSGRFDSLMLARGGSFSPGDGVGLAHTGSASWLGGSQAVFDMAAASGVAGSDWDLWFIDGALRLNVSSNPLFPMRLALRASALPGFDTQHAGQWLLIDTEDGIQGFVPGALQLDLSGFAPDLHGGQLSLGVSGGDLYLQFAPVPEPPAWLLLGAGLLLSARRRRPRA